MAGMVRFPVSFNPHTHEGCDKVYNSLVTTFLCFNPHTHEGCDTTRRHRSTVCRSFNPHTHEGCDNYARAKSFQCWGFNPHTHEGCDFGSSNTNKTNKWFQSTHPRRVWLSVVSLLHVCSSFNPHTHEGCDCIWLDINWPPVKVSIHTPTKGVTCCWCSYW